MFSCHIERLYFDLCYEEYSLRYRYKKINNKLWKDWDEGIRSALSKHAFKESWKIINQDTLYSNEFDEYINKIISREKGNNK